MRQDEGKGDPGRADLERRLAIALAALDSIAKDPNQAIRDAGAALYVDVVRRIAAAARREASE